MEGSWNIRVSWTLKVIRKELGKYRKRSKTQEENKDMVTSKREWLRERRRGWGEGKRGLESEKRRKKKVRFKNNWNVFRQCELRKTSVYLDTKSINNSLILSVTVTVIPPCLWVIIPTKKKVLKQTKNTNTKQKEKSLYCEIFKHYQQFHRLVVAQTSIAQFILESQGCLVKTKQQ